MMVAEVTSPEAAGAGPPAVLLDVRGLEVTYEKVELAVQGVSVGVPVGKVVVVLGANGAGKTTLLRAICGFLPGENARITDGEILFDGTRVSGWAPHRTARLGVVMVPEREKIFPTLTVRENLRVGVRHRGPEHEDSRALVADIFPVLEKKGSQIAGYLSGGERQMLAIASALLCSPRALLIDELSLGLAPNLVDELFGLVKQICVRRNLPVLIVEQNAVSALKIADYAYVLESGRIVLDGTPERLRAHEDVREFYLGLGDQGENARSFAHVKQYKRRRRWWG
jgi:branched-chain amino acid transport system ATP-binding protein